jgi:DNA-binding NarL/FixJ family response regulator
MVAAGVTPRELEVIEALAQGLSNDEIAEALHLAPESVRTTVRRLLPKAGVHHRAGLMGWAFRHGLVTDLDHP